MHIFPSHENTQKTSIELPTPTEAPLLRQYGAIIDRSLDIAYARVARMSIETMEQVAASQVVNDAQSFVRAEAKQYDNRPATSVQFSAADSTADYSNHDNAAAIQEALIQMNRAFENGSDA